MSADGTLALGLQFGYWTARPQPARELVQRAREAEDLGFDSIWTGEAWSSDAFSPLAAIAAATSKVKLATGIAQISARSPVTAAMHALTLDGLSEGRAILGLGVGGPQVVEGWYGQPFGQPLARTREYVDIVRAVWRRDAPVTSAGPHYPLPYVGQGAVGLGKPLKSITHPLRSEIPIHLGAEGPRNVALAAEIAHGWLPLYYSPWREDVYAEHLGETKPGFEISVNVAVSIDDDIERALLPVKGTLGFYIGGMGARTRNFHKELMARMGYAEEADRVQELFFAGRREEAIMAVPSAFADEISLVGPPARIRERLQVWRSSRVTRLLVGSQDPAVLRLMAELVNGFDRDAV